MIRVIAVILGCLLVSQDVFFAEAQSKKPDVKKLSTELKDTRSQKKQVQTQLRQNKTEQRAVKSSIRTLDGRLNELNAELATTVRRLEESRAEQKRLEGESAVAMSRLQERREQARRRVRQLYIRGNASLASAFVGAQSMGDLASRRFLFQRVTQRDKELFDDVKRLHATVLHQKNEADKLVKKINGLLASQKDQESDLKVTRSQKRQALTELRGDQIELEKILAELQAEERAIAATLAAYYRTTGKRTGLKFSGRLGMPVSGRLSSSFGMRKHPILRVVRLHAGVDFGASSGTAIKASADGIVISASYMRGYGNCIIVDHGGGVSTLYAHCSRLLARAGERVKRGEKIATVGSTGLATAPHLHFEVRVNGKPVNPLSWL